MSIIFLPVPNRVLVFGSLGLIGTLCLGTVASTFLTYRTTVKAQAIVQPVGEVQTIQANGNGNVERIFVKNYDTIKSNQQLVSLDNSSLRTEVFKIETQIAQLQKQIDQVNNELSILEQRKAAQASNRQGQLSVGEAQAFQYSKDLLLAHQSDLNVQLNYQQNLLRQAEKKIDNLTVLSTAEGTLYGLTLNTLGQSVKSNDVIAKVLPEGTALEIKASTADINTKDVEIGFPVRINLANCKSFRLRPLKGHISSVKPAAPPTSSVLLNTAENSYTVTVEADEQELQTNSNTCRLLPGTEGEITIILKQEKLSDFFLRKLRLRTNA